MRTAFPLYEQPDLRPAWSSAAVARWPPAPFWPGSGFSQPAPDHYATYFQALAFFQHLDEVRVIKLVVNVPPQVQGTLLLALPAMRGRPPSVEVY